MAYHDVMEGLGRLLEIEGFEFEDQGAYFEIDDRSVFLRHEADQGRLTLAAPIEVPEEGDGEDLARRLLRLSFETMRDDGTALGLEETSGAYVVLTSLLLEGLTAQTLAGEVARIASVAETAHLRLAVARAAGEAESAAPADDLYSQFGQGLIRG